MQVKYTSKRQKEIIGALRKLIVSSGSEHVTIKNIANLVGTSEGALYRHFASKKDMLRFLVDDAEEILLEDFKDIYPGQFTSLDSLTDKMMKHISAIVERRGVAFLVIAEIISFGDPELNKKIYGVIRNYTETVELLLLEAASNGLIKTEIDLKSAAMLFFGMIQGLVNIWALDKFKPNLREQFKALWEIFIKSISQQA